MKQEDQQSRGDKTPAPGVKAKALTAFNAWMDADHGLDEAQVGDLSDCAETIRQSLSAQPTPDAKERHEIAIRNVGKWLQSEPQQNDFDPITGRGLIVKDIRDLYHIASLSAQGRTTDAMRVSAQKLLNLMPPGNIALLTMNTAASGKSIDLAKDISGEYKTAWEELDALLNPVTEKKS